jgi:tetratricopeptide (TPR) repeat protein
MLQARVQRGNVLLKQGSLDEAEVDYRAVVRIADSGGITYLIVLQLDADQNQADARSKLDGLAQLRENIDLGNRLFETGDLESAEFYFTKAIEVCHAHFDAAVFRLCTRYILCFVRSKMNHK